jgi:anaerobic magnesium-protoporphyrin IX monomethyl ester cyclase
MRCALVVPQWRADEIFLSAFTRSMRSYQEPSGPLYIGATLLEAGHEVVLLDGALLTDEEILAGIADFEADFVGIYVCAPLWKGAKRLVRGIRERAPATFVGVGGPWPSAVPQRCFDESPELDAAFLGEGEYLAVETVEALEKRAPLRGIQGLWYRDRETGEIVENEERPPIPDLDALPFPARHLMGDNIELCTLPPGGYRRKPVAHLIGSRGCTNRCIYCFHLERKAGIRYRSPANMVAEMEECVQRYGFREVRFLDDNFTGDRERVLEFCDLLIRKGNKTPWYVSSRIDTVDLEMLKAMKKAGCWALLYGIESGVQKNLDMLRKNVTLDQVRQVVADTKKAGIKMFTPYMFGIPGETFEEGLETIRFAIELDTHYANFNCLTPFPGTWLWDHGHEWGTMNGDTDRLTFQGSAFVPHTMTAEQIEELRKIAFRKFYSRPRFMLRWLAGVRSWEDFSTIMKGGMSFLVMWMRRNAFRFEPGNPPDGEGKE